MPSFTIVGPQGEEYEIEAPDGATKEQAFEFFKREHSAGRAKPKKSDAEKSTEQMAGIGSKLLGAGETALSIGTGGLAQLAGGLAGAAITPFAGADAGANAVRNVSQYGYQPRTDKGKEYTDTIGSLFEAGTQGLAKTAPNLLGAVPLIGDKILDNLDKDPNAKETLSRGMAEFAMNYLPLDVAARGIGVRPKGKPPVVEAPKGPSITEKMDAVQQDKPVGQYTQQDALPLDNSVETIADMQRYGQNPNQLDLFGDNSGGQTSSLVARRAEEAKQARIQQALQERQLALEQDVTRKQQLDFNAAERARMEQAPIPGLAESRTRVQEAQRIEAEQSAAQLAQLNEQGQQMGLDFNDFGNNDPMARMPNMRVDENGIPIRADLSMEAQNLQNPLQRNLWGDELPIETGDGGIPLTQAIDSMPAGAAREAGLAQLRGEVPGSMELPRNPTSGLGSPSLIKGMSKTEKGALDPEVFLQGYRAVNRVLSNLTNMPWVKERFPSDKYMTNKDGTPMILLHGTRHGFNDRVRTKGEGIHAGYGAEAAHMFTSNRKAQQRTVAFPSRLQHNDTSAIYPMAVRKGIYPYIDKDIGGWSAEDVLNSHGDQPNQVVVEAIAKETGMSPITVDSIMDDFYRSLKDEGLDTAGWNKEFSDFLERRFSIRGFFYKNTFESTKGMLSTHAGEFPTPKRARNLADTLDHNKSFVTWDNANLESLYGDTPIPKDNKPASWMSGLGNKQGGALDFKAIFETFSPSKTVTDNPLPREDSVATPISAENIAKRKLLSDKANALKIQNQYSRVTTMEEALALMDPKTDMWKAGATNLRSGLGAATRTNVKNSVLNYLRNLTQTGRNTIEKDIKNYITDNKTGYVAALKKLSQKEKNDVAELLMGLSKRKLEPSETWYNDVGLNDNQKAVARLHAEMMEAVYNRHLEASRAIGVTPGEYRQGYSPNRFSGAYASFVGHTASDGTFVVTGIAEGDTKWQHKAAVEKYKEMGKHYSEAVPMPRKGLRTTAGYSRVYSGFNDLLVEMAKNDPKFAEVKAAVDEHAANEVSKLYKFNVHDIKRRGVKGSIGDRPWLDKDTNTNQFFESVIDYAETGFRYNAMLKPIHDMTKLITDPTVRQTLPNTVEFLEKQKAHLMGRNLNNLGATFNSLIDAPFKAAGIGPSIPRAGMRILTETSVASLTGLVNLGFFGLQLAQLPLTLPAEAAAIARGAKLSPQHLATAVTTTPVHLLKLVAGNEKGVPQHLVDAYKWAQDAGIFTYNESHLASDLQQGPVVKGIRKVAHAPSIYGEKLTRPPIFMIFADMFHKAGYKGEEAFLRAQEATNHSMADYHADERPAVYETLGEVGRALAAYTTFKHNFIEQQVGRGVNAKRQPEAAAIAAGMVLGVYGLMGMPGAQEASQLSESLTGKSIREWVLNNPEQSSVLLDGAISAKSDVDIQARLASASLLPDSPLSAAPHVANMWNVFSAAYQAGVDRDVGSLENLASKGLPVFAKNIYEATHLTDEQGVVRNAKGEKNVEQPRTPNETLTRAITGVKPLRERIQSETLWTKHQRKLANDKKLTDLSNRFETAIRLDADPQDIINEYQDLGGDPRVLLNRINEIKEKANMTPKARKQGKPGDSLSSIRKMEAY